MKKILIYSLLFVTLIACEKLDKYTQFTLDYHVSFFVPANTQTQTPVNLETVEVPINDEIFAEYKTAVDLIEKVSIKKIEISVPGTTNTNLDFLNDIEIYLEAEGLPKVRIAWKNNIPNNASTLIELDKLSDNIAEYFKQGQFRLSTVILDDQSLTENLTLGCNLTFYIDAEVTGD